MNLSRSQARKLLWLASARLEETVGPEGEVDRSPALKALVSRGLAVIEPSPRTGIVALSLTDAGRAEAERRTQKRVAKQGPGWKQLHYRGCKTWTRTEAG